MASNFSMVTDNFGEYEDWIELYNTSTSPVDISGFYLTDNPINLNKWEIPAGTVIQPNDYLIIWADEDSSQGSNHANFKLSIFGEILMLLDTSLNIVDSLIWGQQTANLSYARVPNRTGPFIIQGHTFGANNNNLVGLSEDINHPVQLTLYPKPASDAVQVQLSDDRRRDLEVYDAVGRIVEKRGYSSILTLSTLDWPAGIYYLRCGEAAKKLVVRH